MKTLLIFTAGALLACSALAQGDFSTRAVHRNVIPPPSGAEREGSLQRGFRLGNPLQLLNPFAPRRYGSGTDFLVPRDQDSGLRRRDTSREYPVGVRLVTITF